MKDLTIHNPLHDYFSYLTVYGDRVDLAEFGKNATVIMILLYVGGKLQVDKPGFIQTTKIKKNSQKAQQFSTKLSFTRERNEKLTFGC